MEQGALQFDGWTVDRVSGEISRDGHTNRLPQQPLRILIELADRVGCRVAGHTHVIGFFQSGTHVLRPGETPSWSPTEGVRFDGSEAVGALGSSPFAPSTITCLHCDPPRGRGVIPFAR